MARTIQSARARRGTQPSRPSQSEAPAPPPPERDLYAYAEPPPPAAAASSTEPAPQFTLEFQLFPHSDLPLHRQDSHNRPFVFAPVEKRISGPNGPVIQIGRKIDRAAKIGDQSNSTNGTASLVGPRGTTREDRALHNVSTDPAHMSTGDKTAAASTTRAAPEGDGHILSVYNPLFAPVRVDGGGAESNQEQAPVPAPQAEQPAQPSSSSEPINAEPSASAEETIAPAVASAPAQPPTECIAFRSKVVSRHHAEIFVGEDGQLYFRDVGSSSGSFLNRLRLSATGKASRPFPLKSGDVIQLGVDYQGRQEEIYKAVMIKIFINSKRSAPALASKQRLNKALRSLLHAMNPNSKKEDEANTTVECCICINSMSPFQALFLAPCSHCFHYKCVTTLLGAGFMFQCPLCRQVANLEASVAEPDDLEAEYPQEDEQQVDSEEPEDVEMETDAPPPPATTAINNQTLKRRSGSSGEKRSADDAMLGDDEEEGGGAGPMSSDEEVAGRLEMDVEEIPGPSAAAPATSSFAAPFVNSIAVNIPGPSRSGHYNLDTSLIVSPSTPQNTSNHLTSNPTSAVSTTATGGGAASSSRRGPDIPVQIFNTLTKLSDSLARGDDGGVERCMGEYAGQVHSLLRGLARHDAAGGEEGRQLVEQMIAALQQQSE